MVLGCQVPSAHTPNQDLLLPHYLWPIIPILDAWHQGKNQLDFINVSGTRGSVNFRTTKLVAIISDNVKHYRFTSRCSSRVRRGSADSLNSQGFPPARVISGVCDIF